MTNPGVYIPVSRKPDRNAPPPAWQQAIQGRCRVVVQRISRVSQETLRLRVSENMSIYEQRTGGKPVSSKKNRQGEIWQEVDIKPKDFEGGLVKTFWIQGDERSANNREPKIELRPAANPAAAAYGQSDATVVEFLGQTVRMPSTPALTQRAVPGGPASNQPVPAAQEFRIENLPGGNPDEIFRSRSFEQNPPIVTIAGSHTARPVEIEAIVYPGGLPFVKWYCQRDPDDPAALRAGGFVDPVPLEFLSTAGNPDGSDTFKLRVPPDAVGSFHIRLKCGSSTLAITNFVSVKAEAVGAEQPHVAIPAAKRAAARAGLRGSLLMARTGPVPFPDPNHSPLATVQNDACAVHHARVRLTGGGRDGKRGLKYIFGGWVQNKSATRIEGEYTDATVLPVQHYNGPGLMIANNSAAAILPIQDPDTGQPMRDRYFFGGGAAPAPLATAITAANPVLDTGRAGDGGITATLGTGKLERVAAAFGEELLVTAVDCPGTEFVARHRTHGSALLTQAIYEHTFVAYLCVWVDLTMANTGTGTGDRLYAVVGDFEWQLEGTWTVAWPHPLVLTGNWWQAGVVAETRNFRAWISRPFARYEARPAEGLVEVRPPTPLQLFAWDHL